ncbi:aldo/keto reductase [Microterricola viridarii]|uniref:Aldo/keto reductase n=1 Tax=Microterricola viridarii TaxID=412690 RepID=A0A120I0S8_9MICO|nr:aldo/keto reductase [Microterricola viridarii]AMB59780.1 aldo/keto reductase [Microterricola viridarii]
MTRALGRGGLVAGPHAFGTAALGNLYSAVEQDVAIDAVHAAWEQGVRYFDTAPHYGLGLSETRLGAGLAGRARDEFVVSTKVGKILVDTDEFPGERDEQGFDVPKNRVRRWDFSRDGVLRSIEGSLTRLGLDRLDVVLVHDPDDHYREALDEAFPALEELRAQGVITSYGAGMNQSAMLSEFVTNTDLDVIMVAGRYSLLEQPALADLLPAAEARGVSIVAAGVFNSGLLATDRPAADAKYNYEDAPAELLSRVNRIADLCESHGVKLPAVAAQFALGHPAVATVCLGARSRAQVERNASLFDVAIPGALWSDLRTAGLLAESAPTP